MHFPNLQQFTYPFQTFDYACHTSTRVKTICSYQNTFTPSSASGRGPMILTHIGYPAYNICRGGGGGGGAFPFGASFLSISTGSISILISYCFGTFWPVEFIYHLFTTNGALMKVSKGIHVQLGMVRAAVQTIHS